MYIHWTFTLLIIWIVGSHFNEGGDSSSLGNRLVFLIAVFACVLLHELGHALSALRYNVKTHDITLLPIGGVARLERIPEKPMQELVVAAAGPAVNVVIALVLFLLLSATGNLPDNFDPSLISESDLGLNLLIVNISLVLFNLIPAFPMDGGRMLRAALGMKLRREVATRYAAGLGQLLAVGFMVLGFFYNPVLMFIGLFIFLGARQESAHVTRTEMLRNVKVRELMLTEFKVLKHTESLRDAVQHLLAVEQSDFLVENEWGKITGLLTRDNLLRGISEQGMEVSVSSVMVSAIHGIQADQPAMSVFESLSSSGAVAAPVMEGERLVGMLTLTNIREYFLVRFAVELNKN